VPRSGLTHVLVSPTADAHVQLNTASAQTLALNPQCTAVMLFARGGTGPVNVTWDDTVPSSTNGLPIIVNAQPVFIPLGRHAGGNGNLRALGGAGSSLDVLQLA
jgi:hypothetical protein